MTNPSITPPQSGKDIGQAYLQQVRLYLEQLPTLPLMANGTVNMTAIAAGACVPRQSLYKNPGIRELLEGWKMSFEVISARTQSKASLTPAPNPVERPAPIQTASSKQVQLLERRITKLEQHNALLMAENAELRRQSHGLRLQINRLDLEAETGRRIPAPPPHE
jgi:hypothetical protein